jgi:hypothetical protein
MFSVDSALGRTYWYGDVIDPLDGLPGLSGGYGAALALYANLSTDSPVRPLGSPWGGRGFNTHKRTWLLGIETF